MRRHLEPDAGVALLDVPAHTNVGDHAILLGQLRYLRRNGNSLSHISTINDYSADRLAERLHDSVILLHGGGNVGDLWPHHQMLRERVLADFPRARIVQLPQSIRFERKETLERARRSFGTHPDFTLLVRDGDALAFAQTHFNCRVELCPDAAFQLGLQTRRVDPDVDVLVLARTDHETSAPFDLHGDDQTAIVDWIGDESRRFRTLRLATGQIAAKARRAGLTTTITGPGLRRAYEILARDRVESGLSLLSRGHVVVTDRLHGHILCTLLGIPHVIHDAGYGKVAGFHATWSPKSPIVTVCRTQAEAIAVARRLATELRV